MNGDETSSRARDPSPEPAGGGGRPPAPGVAVRDLTIRVPGRALLEGARADFPAGKVTLVVGASGAGKTVLLKVLAGLLPGGGEREIEVRGSVRLQGEEVLGARGARKTGIVFQNFALFDELSSLENIAFARDHRRGAAGSPELEPRALLETFHIPPQTPVASLSGGQQQRLAIARTLAFDPEVLIYDEPTSGLDPHNAARVAGRIRATCEARGKTTVVVTHDYQHLAPIADAAYLLDPVSRQLVPVAVPELQQPGWVLPGASAFDEDEGRPVPSPPALARLGRLALRFLEASGAGLEKGLLLPLHFLPLWRSARWGLRYLRHYLALVASFSSWLYFACAGVIAGFVSTYFSFKFLPHRKYAEPLLGDELLNGLGFVIYRSVVPVLVTILLAARCGSAVASDVGARVYSQQADAMRSFGAWPSRYLLTGILWALAAASPLLVALGYLAASATSLVVFTYTHPLEGPQFWDSHFHRDLRVPGEVLYRGTVWLLAKVLACGAGVGSIAYHVGIGRKQSAADVSRGITRTVIWATLYVLAVHFAFAFWEF